MAARAGSTHTAGGWNALEQRRHRRALYLLVATGCIMLALGTGWCLFFAWQGAWWVVAVETALALLGIAVIATARGGHRRAASWLAFIGLFVYVSLFSALLDVQTPHVPRSTHLFLLVLAACAHHVFRSERPWLRYGSVVVLLLAFVVFAALPDAIPASYAIPDRMRHTGIWINLVSVAASLLVVLRLAESDGVAHRTLHRALRDALAARRFELYYQPQLDATGRTVGAEALLRWNDPGRGVVAPGEFVQAAEDTGFILPLGHWVLATACEQLQAWRDRPVLGALRLSVNVSALQLQQPDFVDEVLEVLQRSGVDPRRLTLELTESVLAHDMEDVAAKMRALHAAGVRLSLDDFGTGWSSLSYLRAMPLAELKIDRAFTAEVTRDGHAASITRNLLQLGHDLGIDVIAEGIEHAAQYEALRAQGCDLFQGYLFGAPMRAVDFERLVEPDRAGPD